MQVRGSVARELLKNQPNSHLTIDSVLAAAPTPMSTILCFDMASHMDTKEETMSS